MLEQFTGGNVLVEQDVEHLLEILLHLLLDLAGAIVLLGNDELDDPLHVLPHLLAARDQEGLVELRRVVGLLAQEQARELLHRLLDPLEVAQRFLLLHLRQIGRLARVCGTRTVRLSRRHLLGREEWGQERGDENGGCSKAAHGCGPLGSEFRPYG